MTYLRLTPAAATHRGMRRRQNEDAIGFEYPSKPDVLASHGALFIVADGVGGLSAGNVASQLTVNELIKEYYSRDASLPLERRLVEAAQAVNDTVIESLNKTGATTLVALVIHENKLVGVSAGDSEIFSIRGNQIRHINEADVVHSDDENDGALTKAIGYQDTIDFNSIHLKLDAGDQILLCSDGLTRYLNDEQLLQLVKLRDPRDSVRRMINLANAKGGADNISALLINVGDPIEVQDIAKHIDRISIRVAVDTDPLMMQDVPSKPTTQIPMARAVSSIDESLLDEITPAPQLSQSKVAPVPPPPPRATKNAKNNMMVLIITGVTILLAGAVLLGVAFFSLNNDSAPQVPATESITDDNEASTDMITQAPVESTADSGEALQVGVTITLDQSITTKNDVGSEVDSFLTIPDTPYIIENITQDSEGRSWYRLSEEDTSQTGWLASSDLQNYHILDS